MDINSISLFTLHGGMEQVVPIYKYYYSFLRLQEDKLFFSL